MAEEISQFDGGVTVRLEDTTSIDIEFNVPPEIEMNGTTDIIGVGTDTFDGNLTVRYDPEARFDVSFEIPLFDDINTFDGIATVRIDSVTVLDCIFTVPPNAFLNGNIDIEPTPKRDYFASLEKDTYTKVSNPERNYGGDTKLEFSDDSTILLEYKFSPIDDPFFEPENEADTYLQIYIKKAVHKPTKGYVHTVDDSWSEYFVNESNKPNMTLLTEFDIPENYVGWIEVNLGDVLLDKDKYNETTQSLAITTDGDDYTLSSSKDGTSSDAPKLLYKYYFVPPNIAKSYIDIDMTVRIDNTDSIDINFMVDSNWIEDEINVDFNVPNYENTDSFNATVTAIQTPTSLPLFDGALSVKRFDGQNSFDGQVIAKLMGEGEFDGVIDVPLFDTTDSFDGVVTARLDIKETIDIGLEIPIFDNMESFDGSVISRIDKVDSIDVFMSVPLMSNARAFDGIVTIRYDEVKEIDIDFEVPQFNNIESIDFDLSALEMEVDEFDAYLELPSILGNDSFNGEMYTLSVKDETFDGSLDVMSFDRIDHFVGNIISVITKEDSIDVTFTVRTNNENKAYVFIM